MWGRHKRRSSSDKRGDRGHCCVHDGLRYVLGCRRGLLFGRQNARLRVDPAKKLHALVKDGVGGAANGATGDQDTICA